MQWDETELDTQFTPNVYIWTPNSEILAKAPPPPPQQKVMSFFKWEPFSFFSSFFFTC